MNKQVALSMLIAASTAIIATSSHANSPMLPLENPSSSGPTIYEVITQTPDGKGKVLMANEIIVLTGKTCSTLTVQSDMFPTIVEIPVKTDEDPLTSDDLVMNFGAELGCLKVDIFYDGNKEVTTGNIALTWDPESKQYIAANPSVSNMQF